MYNENEVIKKANDLMDERENKEALAYLEEMSEKCGSMKVLNNLGYFYIYDGVFNEEEQLWYYAPEKAVDVLEKACLLSKECHYPFTNLGIAYYKIGSFEKSVKALELSVSMEKAVINQNNLGCALLKCTAYEQANSVIGELIRQLENFNIYELPIKFSTSLANIEIYSMLFNYALSFAKLNKYDEVKNITEKLLDYYKRDFIDMSDVDIIDILTLFNLCNEHNTVAENYPLEGFEVNNQVFGIYVSSLLSLGKKSKALEFYNKTITDIDEEIEDFQNNDKTRYKKEKLEKCRDRKNSINFIYNSLLENSALNIEIEPKILYSHYNFR